MDLLNESQASRNQLQEDSDASDNFPGLEKNQQIDERENHELSDLWQNKTHSTLRMKKSLST